MLVLSRKFNEVIDLSVGDTEIEIRVVDIRGDKVRLGITAPGYVTVNRREITLAISRESMDLVTTAKAVAAAS